MCIGEGVKEYVPPNVLPRRVSGKVPQTVYLRTLGKSLVDDAFGPFIHFLLL